VKKIIEYLGEEEETLTNFMVSKLQTHCKPQDLLEELQFVLDDDSEQFVLKMWRIMIYHSIRVTLNFD
jgi:RNA-binding protein 25